MNNINNLSFKAKLLYPSTIILKNNNGEKTIENTSFVKLSNADMEQLDIYTENYCDSGLARNITYNMYKESPSKNRQYYAMTLQKDNFETLDPAKILGLAQTTRQNNAFYIDYLQTVTNEAYLKNRYSYIGTSIISNIIRQAQKFKTGFIRLESLPKAKNFYRILNFDQITDMKFELKARNFRKIFERNSDLIQKALIK